MARAYRDSSEINNALSGRQQLNSAQANANIQTTDMDANRRQLALEKESIQAQREDNWFNLSLGIAELRVDTASQAYKIIKKDQSTKGQLTDNEALQDGEKLLIKSLYNGSTYFNDQGEMVFSQEYLDWKDTYRQQIESSKGMKSVIDNRLATFDYNVASLEKGGMETALKTFYTDLNNNHTKLLEESMQADVNSYVAAGGDMTLWAETPVKGVAIIQNRTDWSDATKVSESTAYMAEVRKQGDIEIASKLALSEGKDAAWKYLEGRGYLTVQEKQSAYSTAAKAVSLRSDSVAQASSDFIEDVLTNPESGLSAYEGYLELEKQYANESTEIKASAIEAARKKHKELATIAGNNQYVADKESGLDSLYKTRDALVNGDLDGFYYNIEDSKNTLLQKYETEIAAQEKAIASATSTDASKVRTADKNAVSDYQSTNKTNLQLFDAGILSGKDLMENAVQNADTFRSQLQGEGTELQARDMEINAAMYDTINKVIDGYVPSKYQDAVKTAVSGFNTALGLDMKTTLMDADQLAAYTSYNAYYNGMIADYIYDNGAAMNPQEFQLLIQQMGESLALSYTDSSWKKIGAGTAIGSGYGESARKTFKDINATIWNSDNDQYFFYYANAQPDFANFMEERAMDTAEQNGEEYAPKYFEPTAVFATTGVEKTFYDMAAYVATQVSYVTGEAQNELYKSATPGRDDNGKPNLSPVIYAADGTAYRIRDDKIQVNHLGADGEAPVWTDTGYKPTITRNEMSLQMSVTDEDYVEKVVVPAQQEAGKKNQKPRSYATPRTEKDEEQFAAYSPSEPVQDPTKLEAFMGGWNRMVRL